MGYRQKGRARTLTRLGVHFASCKHGNWVRITADADRTIVEPCSASSRLLPAPPSPQKFARLKLYVLSTLHDLASLIVVFSNDLPGVVTSKRVTVPVESGPGSVSCLKIVDDI